jgi:hypothetical protein
MIISSMYLGGFIIFLGMVDFSVTSSFIDSMSIISLVDTQKNCTEFRPDIDEVQAIRNLKKLRHMYHILSSMGTIVNVFY